MFLIGVTGRARSGKDTVGEYVTGRYGLQRLAFADPIKAGVGAMLGLSITDESKDEIVQGLGITPRALMQVIGTECGRHLSRDLWVMLAERAYKQIHARGVIVTDVRFRNEADWIRGRGGLLIHVERQVAPYVRVHASEQGVEWQDGDARAQNNSTVAVLYHQVDAIIAARFPELLRV